MKRTIITLYVEGGGTTSQLKRDCVNGFTKLFENAGFPRGSIRVVACGSREAAFTMYRDALAENENALLLVDSEVAVPNQRDTEQPVEAWQFLTNNNTWTPTADTTPDRAHLMVPTMEAWLLADKKALAEYYRGAYNKELFNDGVLPPRPNVEQLTKAEINRALAAATRDNQKKGQYHKGNHSFDLLGGVNPQLLADASYHAKRLFCRLREALKITLSWKLDCSAFDFSTATP